MSIQLAVFDIDGTLAKTEDEIPSHVAEQLREIEGQGIRIVLISGRTASYLAGLARGMGIKNPLVAGENGGVLFEPASKWERKLEAIPHQLGEEMKRLLQEEMGDLWFQPNQTMLTAAPKDLAMVDQLHQAVLQLKPVSDHHYKINKYDDAVEIMPQENSKGRALAVIKEILHIRREEVMVFGNTVVDLPMKTEAETFIIIGDGVKGEGIHNFVCIEEALNYLQRYL